MRQIWGEVEGADTDVVKEAADVVTVDDVVMSNTLSPASLSSDSCPFPRLLIERTR